VHAVVHSEMPTEEVLEKGGVMEGFQLWVNLPAKDKMIKPRYQVETRAMYACVCARAHVH
jgi:redox-sensitive bicupin YhaK (pirin superfamily)